MHFRDQDPKVTGKQENRPRWLQGKGVTVLTDQGVLRMLRWMSHGGLQCIVSMLLIVMKCADTLLN